MVDYDSLTETDKAQYARQILSNPVFMYHIDNEILLSTEVAVNNDDPIERDKHRWNVIWLRTYKKRIEDLAQIRS